MIWRSNSEGAQQLHQHAPGRRDRIDVLGQALETGVGRLHPLEKECSSGEDAARKGSLPHGRKAERDG
jgi:hypothetical protein